MLALSSVAAALALTPYDAAAVTFRFDYRFDGGFFSQHPERKKTLELAAEHWAELLPDRFDRITPGTVIKFRHPQTGEPLSAAVPAHNGDVLVFVFAFPNKFKASAKPLFGGIAGYEEGRRTFTRKAGPRGVPVRNLYQRAAGNPFQPWAGTLSVDTQTGRPWYFAQSIDRVEDIPIATHYDFLTTALHELGHILGIYMASSPFAFTDLVRDGQFVGPRSVALDRRPIPLHKESGHIAGDYNSATWNGRLILARPHIEAYEMHSVAPVQSLRAYPTELDLAMLEDIGYTVNWSRLRRSPYVSAFPRPQQQRPQQLVGLWQFRKPADLDRAEVGYPLLYMPASSGLIAGTFDRDHVQIPHRAFLYADHGMSANGGGKYVNQYTLAFDIRLPKLGEFYSLLNTSPHNANPGDLWISKAGQLGEGNYSREALRPATWHRVVFVADLTSGERRYYLDGKLVLRQSGEKLDGRMALYPVGAEKPFLTLFADSNGDSAPIDVRQVALWNYALPETTAVALGGPDIAIKQ